MLDEKSRPHCNEDVSEKYESVRVQAELFHCQSLLKSGEGIKVNAR